ASPGSNTVTVINAMTHAIIDTIAVRAGQLAVNSVTNRIYSASLNVGTLSVIDGVSHAVTAASWVLTLRNHRIHRAAARCAGKRNLTAVIVLVREIGRAHV